jgi:hypothetical protein
MVCGSQGVANDNAFYGFVFSSSDGGKMWRAALEDKNSTWVTEQSCAFGMNGRAYFVSEASRVIDGEPHHDQGTTRIFVSNDAGRTWTEATKTDWADYSASVVDTSPGANQNRLYVFFNDVNGTKANETNPGTNEVDDKVETSRAGFITFQEGDKHIQGPIASSRMGLLGNQGSFPVKAFLLKDGSLVSLYIGERGILGAVRTSGLRSDLSTPVVVAKRAFQRAEEPCVDVAAAYERLENRVYVAYDAAQKGACRFFLTFSSDGGVTWSRGQKISVPDVMRSNFHSPDMAFNREGILGLIWRATPTSDCWYFAASSDYGKTFSRRQPLSQCSNGRQVPLTESSASLQMQGFLWVNHDLQSGVAEGGAVPGLHVVDHRNVAQRNNGALTVTLDDLFHAAWVETGSGEGQLRTAAVRVSGSGQNQLFHLNLEEKTTRDISRQIVVLYGGEQRYDISSSTLIEHIVLKNKSSEPIRSPLVLKALTLRSEVGKVEIANASNGLSGPGAIWDLSKAVPNGVLEPGATSEPYSLVFRVPKDAAPRAEVDLISVQLQVLARETPTSPRR